MSNIEEDVRYARDELDMINQILSEQKEKAFKYDCLIKKIHNKIEELKEIKYEEVKYEEIENTVNGLIIRTTKKYDYEIANFTIEILKELLEEK